MIDSSDAIKHGRDLYNRTRLYQVYTWEEAQGFAREITALVNENQTSWAELGFTELDVAYRLNNAKGSFDLKAENERNKNNPFVIR